MGHLKEAIAWVRGIQHVLHSVKNFHYSLREAPFIFPIRHICSATHVASFGQSTPAVKNKVDIAPASRLDSRPSNAGQ